MKNFTSYIVGIGLLTLFHPGLKAQQDVYKWRVGIGIANSYHKGNLMGDGAAVSHDLVSLKSNFLSYGLTVEKLLSESWGAKAWLLSSPGMGRLQSASLLLVYYTDNRDFLGKRKLVAPYLYLGLGNDRVKDQFNIPFGAGLKLRVSQRVNLNLDYTVQTYPEAWDKPDFKFSDNFVSLASISLHYNFIKKA